jgi:hypothetical protein
MHDKTLGGEKVCDNKHCDDTFICLCSSQIQDKMHTREKLQEYKQFSFLPVPSKDMNNFTMERNSMYASNVESLYSFWFPSYA